MKLIDGYLRDVAYEEIEFKPECLDMKGECGQWDMACIPYNDPELQKTTNSKDTEIVMNLKSDEMEVSLYVNYEDQIEKDENDFTEFDVIFSVAEKIKLHNFIMDYNKKIREDKVRSFVQNRLQAAGKNNYALSSDSIEGVIYSGDWISNDMLINVTALIEDVNTIDFENGIAKGLSILEYSYVNRTLFE